MVTRCDDFAPAPFPQPGASAVLPFPGATPDAEGIKWRNTCDTSRAYFEWENSF